MEFRSAERNCDRRYSIRGRLSWTSHGFFASRSTCAASYASSKDDYINAFGLLQAGAVDLDILTREYPLSRAEQGFLDSEALKVTKVLLDCS